MFGREVALTLTLISCYLEMTMQLLYTLLKEVEECESRIKILEVLNAIIDGCGKDVSSIWCNYNS